MIRMMMRIKAPMPIYMPSPCLRVCRSDTRPNAATCAVEGSVVRHVAALRAERTPLVGPALDAAGHRVGVEPGAAQRLRRHERAAADAAVEDHRLLCVERPRRR